jgi:osmotically-inducible protein OsmY
MRSVGSDARLQTLITAGMSRCNDMHCDQFTSLEGQAMTDGELQEHVQNALDREPSIDAADIGVSVDAGMI